MQNTEQQAHEAWDRGDLQKAFSLFKQAYQNGSKSCAINIGYFYDEGLGTPKSKSTALRWYRLAYLDGDSSAATNAAIICRERHQFKCMFQWFRKACESDDGDAEVELAKCFLAGAGTAQSHRQALARLRRALKSSHITQAAKEEANAWHRRLTGRSSGRQHWPWLRHFHGQYWYPTHLRCSGAA